MNMTTACRYVLTLTLVSATVHTQMETSGQASPSSATRETRKPSPGGTAESGKTTPPRTTPNENRKQAPLTPPNRTQEIEERVRSGQMDQPIAQGEISQRLNQLEAGSKSFSDDTAARP